MLGIAICLQIERCYNNNLNLDRPFLYRAFFVELSHSLLSMPLLVSNAGEYGVNGTYYQEANDPPTFVQTNRKHCILQRTQIINQGYGGCYRSKVWVLQKMDTCNTALYMSYSGNNTNSQCFKHIVEWKQIAGDRPVPQFRLLFLFFLTIL